MTSPSKYDFSAIAAADPEVLPVMEAEVRRQQNTLELIASENHVSRAVLQALPACGVSTFYVLTF